MFSIILPPRQKRDFFFNKLKYWRMKTTISLFGITREFSWTTGECGLPFPLLQGVVLNFKQAPK